jgi:superfamily II DNA/RNA helicase
VVPSSAPVQRILHVLRSLNVNARGLDLLTPSSGKSFLLRAHDSAEVEELPSLIVSTLASTRGLDMPDLSHVFILGMPEGRLDAYLHIAGRTGRFGSPGKVISVVEGQDEHPGEDIKVTKNVEKKMGGMLKEMGVEPIKVDHFD